MEWSVYNLILSGFLASVWGGFFFCRERTLHGRAFVKKGVHKDFFVLFYLHGLVWLGVLSGVYPSTSCSLLLGMHMGRRLFESMLYTYKIFSRMSVAQMLCGLVYYPVIVWNSFFVKEKPLYLLFWSASVAQLFSHFFLFKRRMFTYYTHYATEALIHYSMNKDILNTGWIVSFSLINAVNRRNTSLRSV
ncbi:hypothetical protein NECID01_0675 [Nematocida sp. AWRm77]|nr:hypothetical protein NECID01_0675 [Nematocida sp. AWRm77]